LQSFKQNKLNRKEVKHSIFLPVEIAVKKLVVKTILERRSA